MSGSRFESLPDEDDGEGDDSFLTSPSRAPSIRSQQFESTPLASTSSGVTPLRKPKRRSPRFSSLRSNLYSEEQPEGLQFKWDHFKRVSPLQDDSGIEDISRLYEESEESIEQKRALRGDPKNIDDDIEYLREIGYFIEYPNGRLGNGMFGVVYRGYYGTNFEDFANVEPNRRFAVKVVDFSRGGYSDSDRENFESEKFILTEVNHKNVVTIRMIINMGEQHVMPFEDFPKRRYLSPDRVYLIMDYADQGELEYYLAKNYNTIMPSTRIKFVRDLYWGMLYLHKQHILHGDVHIGNVLVFTGYDEELIAKWSDFGLSGIACKKQYRHRRPQITRSYFQEESPFDIIGMTTIFDKILENRTLGPVETDGEKEMLDECQRMVRDCRNVETLEEFSPFIHVLQDELFFDEQHYA